MESLELTEYCCGNCHGNTWELSVAHSDTGKTYLVISCANKDCVKKRREELDVDENDTDALVIWDQFDISGQGYDKQEEEDNATYN